MNHIYDKIVCVRARARARVCVCVCVYTRSRSIISGIVVPRSFSLPPSLPLSLSHTHTCARAQDCRTQNLFRAINVQGREFHSGSVCKMYVQVWLGFGRLCADSNPPPPQKKKQKQKQKQKQKNKQTKQNKKKQQQLDVMISTPMAYSWMFGWMILIFIQRLRES